jgi:hypothetical protein
VAGTSVWISVDCLCMPAIQRFLGRTRKVGQGSGAVELAADMPRVCGVKGRLACALVVAC